MNRQIAVMIWYHFPGFFWQSKTARVQLAIKALSFSSGSLIFFKNDESNEKESVLSEKPDSLPDRASL